MEPIDHPNLPALLQENIGIPERSDTAQLSKMLEGLWHHPGWAVQLVPRNRDWGRDRMWLQWVGSPLRFRVFFGPDYAADGQLIGEHRIDWSNGTTWYKNSPLYARESRKYSQNNEDGVLLALLAALGITKPTALEFGVSDGRECNTRILREAGCHVVQWDRDYHDPGKGLFREHITLEDLPEIVRRYQIPRDVDVLSIDVDYYDFYFWWRINRDVAPRIVIIEYNASYPPNDDRLVTYDGPDKHWDGTRYHGASLLALDRLARRMGYVLVYCESRGVNAFFVREDQVSALCNLVPKAGDLQSLYRRASFGAGGHPQDPLDRPFATAASLLSAPRPFWELAR